MLDRLPRDLQTRILELASPPPAPSPAANEGRSTLYACILVCRSLQHVAQNLLWREMDLDEEDAPILLRKLIVGGVRRSLVRAVTTLTARCVDEDDDDEEQEKEKEKGKEKEKDYRGRGDFIKSVLRHLPNVKEVKLFLSLKTGCDAALLLRTVAPIVTSLWLEIYKEKLHQHVAPPCVFSKLHSLRLSTVAPEISIEPSTLGLLHLDPSTFPALRLLVLDQANLHLSASQDESDWTALVSQLKLVQVEDTASHLFQPADSAVPLGLDRAVWFVNRPSQLNGLPPPDPVALDQSATLPHHVFVSLRALSAPSFAKLVKVVQFFAHRTAPLRSLHLPTHLLLRANPADVVELVEGCTSVGTEVVWRVQSLNEDWRATGELPQSMKWLEDWDEAHKMEVEA